MDDRLDRILDEGLASYAGGEPLAGLEERILGRLPLSEEERLRTKGWRLALSAALVGAAVVWFVWPQQRETRPIARPVEVAALPIVPKEIARRVEVARVRRRRVSREKALPKLAVFPTPTPLTTEERLLSAMMARDPNGTLAAFESLRKQSEPLEIKELVIEPLEKDGGQ